MFNDDKALFEANGGPGGGYDKYVEGKVIRNLEEYYESMKF